MNTIRVMATGAMLALATVSLAQVDTGRPKDATAVCKDGTFYSGDDQTNACRRNGGVQEWWGKVVAPKDVPDAHPKPTVPPAGEKPPR